jgi:hypothetical protein
MSRSRKQRDKGLIGFTRRSAEGRIFTAGTGGDWTNGHRGMARDVRGAKKYIRTRIRFHDKADLRARVTEELDND